MYHDECDFCGKDNELKPENTVLFIFTKEPHYNCVLVICSCLKSTRIFLLPETVEEMREAQIPVYLEGTAPREVVDSWERLVLGQLTPHQEREVAFFAFLLDNGVAA